MNGHVLNDRSFGGCDPPAAKFDCVRGQAAKYPQALLANLAGTFQSDDCAGHRRLYEAVRKPELDPGGRVLDT